MHGLYLGVCRQASPHTKCTILQTRGVSCVATSLEFTSVHIGRAWFVCLYRIYLNADGGGGGGVVSAGARTAACELVFSSVVENGTVEHQQGSFSPQHPLTALCPLCWNYELVNMRHPITGQGLAVVRLQGDAGK